MHFNCRGGTQRRKKSSVRPSFYMEQVGDSFVLFPLLKSISFLVLDMPQGTLTSSKKHSVKGSYLLLNRSHVFSKSALLSKSQSDLVTMQLMSAGPRRRCFVTYPGQELEHFVPRLWISQHVGGLNIFLCIKPGSQSAWWRSMFNAVIYKSSHSARRGAIQHLTKSSRCFWVGHCWCWEEVPRETFIIHQVITQSNMLFTWVLVCLVAKPHTYERLVRIPKPQVELSRAVEISWSFHTENLKSK